MQSEKGYPHEGEGIKRVKSSVCLVQYFSEMMKYRRGYENKR